MRQMENDRWKW